MSSQNGPNSLSELPLVVDVPDQPCQQLYEGNPVLLGYDVVQYHKIPSFRDGGVAVRGDPQFAYNFQGYQFWFSTLQNREAFISDPWRYAPAWGGFCSWGVARERPPEWPWQPDFLGPPASPWEGWLIVNDVLIFNIWADYSDRFLQEEQTNMALAAQRWKDWFGGTLQAGPYNTHCIGHGRLKNWCLGRQPSPWLQPLPTCTVVDSSGSTVVDSSGSTVFDSSGNPAVDSSGNTVVDSSGNTTDGSTTNGSITAANCSDIALSGDVLPEDCTNVNVAGGGIVSGANKFSDFDNSKFSPHQKRLIRILSISGFVLFVVILIALFVCRKRLRALCCSRCDKSTSGAQEQAVAETAKDEESMQPSSSADDTGSSGDLDNDIPEESPSQQANA